ncbi:MAG: DUF177 domain-containing protein [Anaerolineae bacterium]|nr:DUF177 domain-containing protein [Anaerolineae bacterium]
MTDLPRSDNRLLRLNVGFLLKEGPGYSREFSFDQDGTFVVEDVVISQLRGVLRLTRTRQGIVIQGTLRTQIAAECVRCLAPFSLPCHIELSDLFVYPAPSETPRVSTPYIVDDGGFIDLRPIIREEGILAVPIRTLCSPDCKGLCPHCGQNLNEGLCQCTEEHIDPRLAPLRALLDEQ